MKRFFTLLLVGIVGGSLFVNSCSPAENEAIISRLNTLEQVTIVSIQGQITTINATLGTLQGTQTQLSGYVTSLQTSLGGLQGDYNNLQTLVNSLKDKDETFAGELKSLKEYVDQCDGNVKAWVEQSYTSLEKFNSLHETVAGISTGITTINGRLDALDSETQKISANLKEKTDTLTNRLSRSQVEIEGIKADLKKLQDDMDSIKDQMAAIVSAVQSVVVVPDYSDGSVKMTEGAENLLRFEVYPLEAAGNLATLGVSALSLDCVGTETKSDLFTNIPLTGVSFDGEVLKVVADGSKLPDDVKSGNAPVNARLRISDGTVTRSSEYFLLSYCKTEPIVYEGVTIEIKPASDLTENSAVLNAIVSVSKTDTDDVFYGFVYSKSSENLYFNMEFNSIPDTLKTRILSPDGKLACSTRRLDSSEKYYYRAFVSKNNVLYYSNVMAFTTLSITASVVTEEADCVSYQKAKLNGILSLSSVSSNLSVNYGFLYCQGENMTIEELTNYGSRVYAYEIQSDGKFSSTIENLTPTVKYSYAAFACINGETDLWGFLRGDKGTFFYGEVVSFVQAPDYPNGGATESTLCINEVNGTRGYKGIELYNPTDTEIDLQGWVVKKNNEIDGGVDNEGFETRLFWEGNSGVGKIPANGYYVIHANKDDFNLPDNTEGCIATSGLSNKKSLKLELINPAGKVVDTFNRGFDYSYGYEVVLDELTGSFARDTDGSPVWKLKEPSFGATNNDVAIIGDGVITGLIY